MIRRGIPDDFGGRSRGGNRQLANFGHPSRTAATSHELLPGCGRHPLADRASSLALHHRVRDMTAAFDAIEPALRRLAPHQFEEGFGARAAAEVLSRLHLDLPVELFAADWTAPLNMGIIYARCVVGTFRRMIEQGFDPGFAHFNDGETIESLSQRWKLHALDITPFADRRLVDAVRYILRLPQSQITSCKPCPGALFNVDETVRDWERAELRRWRDASSNGAFHTTRYLKMCIYPFSNEKPANEGCVEQDRDDDRAITALLVRLRQFGQSVRLLHGESASVATLLLGVNTSTEAIRVHVPDADGIMHAGRHLNSHILYNGTSALSHNAAKAEIHRAVTTCAGVSGNDAGSAGMRWLCSDLIEANIAHVDFRREGRLLHSASHERLLVVGDPVDEPPMGDFAFQVRTSAFEDGTAELDSGIITMRGFHEKNRLAIPLLVHVRVDPLMPGAMQCARGRAGYLATEIQRRYDHLVSRGNLHIEVIIRDSDGALLPMEPAPAGSPNSPHQCGSVD
jgi:carboxysome shell carbonic anhydrase